MTSSDSGVDAPTGDEQLSFGSWRVTHSRPTILAPKNTILEIHLSATDLTLAFQDGQTMGSWPIAEVGFDVYGNSDGYLRLGVDALWIKSTEKRPAGDLHAAINARKGPRERQPPVDQLAQSSANWTALAVLRQYTNDAQGREQFGREVEILGQHGYSPLTQSVDGGHYHVGRLLLTGGLSALAGKSGTRIDGTIVATFQKSAVAPSPSYSSHAADSQARPTGDTKICPQCAEEVRAAALICRYCRYEFGPRPPPGLPGS